MSEQRDQKAERKKRKNLYNKYGYLIGADTEDIPEKHRCVTGGLRCFRRVVRRDEHGNKDPVGRRKRCGKACSKGSLYCGSHGGGNSKALVRGTRTTATLDAYKGVHTAELQDLMGTFIDDPKILDQKAELVTLRAILHNYIAEIEKGRKQPKNAKKMLSIIGATLENEEMTDVDRLLTIKEVTDSMRALDDGAVIDRINRCIDTIGKTIDRIHKVETKDNFMLTPEGLKILLRGILDVLRDIVAEDVLQQIRGSLMNISIKTGGDLTKYDQIVDAEHTMVE
jgi:hypothetical protein